MVLRGKNNYSWILMGHSVQLLREKKTSMYFGNSLMSFESMMDFKKKITTLVSLIAHIVFNNSFRMKHYT